MNNAYFLSENKSNNFVKTNKKNGQMYSTTHKTGEIGN